MSMFLNDCNTLGVRGKVAVAFRTHSFQVLGLWLACIFSGTDNRSHVPVVKRIEDGKGPKRQQLRRSNVWQREHNRL